MSTVIDLGKIRFFYRGGYNSSSLYEYNDVVKSGGNSYVYINNTATTGKALTESDYWSALVDGMNSTGAWSSVPEYGINDIVTHGGAIYRCTAVNTNQEPPNASYWEVFVQGYNHRGAWVTSTAYKVDDAVTYLGQSYRCTTSHTSGTFLTDLSSNWERYASGVFDRGAYAFNTDYFVGDLAYVGPIPNRDIYVCTADHTSDSSAFPDASPESASWTIWINGQLVGSNAINAFAYYCGLSG